MQLGKFSISLAVKDIKASREFYEKIGFRVNRGKEQDGWVIMENGTATIGLFHNMFDKNILTFNPAWDSNGRPLDNITDARELQAQFEQSGVNFVTRVEPGSQGPVSFTIEDPDGNHILIDQHVE